MLFNSGSVHTTNNSDHMGRFIFGLSLEPFFDFLMAFNIRAQTGAEYCFSTVAAMELYQANEANTVLIARTNFTSSVLPRTTMSTSDECKF